MIFRAVRQYNKVCDSMQGVSSIQGTSTSQRLGEAAVELARYWKMLCRRDKRSLAFDSPEEGRVGDLGDPGTSREPRGTGETGVFCVLPPSNPATH
jgi:hypothetical protein